MADLKTPAEVLQLAAARAEETPTMERAIRRAWQTLHTDHDARGPAFTAWMQAEGTEEVIGEVLSDVVRARHKSPASLAAALRRAAELAGPPGSCRCGCRSPKAGRLPHRFMRTGRAWDDQPELSDAD